MMSKKKKIFILVGMIALLVATGVLNIYLNRNNGSVPGGSGGVVYGSVFDTYRTDKRSTREETLLILDSIIESSANDSQAYTDAVAQKQLIANNYMLETNLEGLIRALGYTEVVVNATAKKLNVIIKADDLDDVQVAQIVHVITTGSEKTPSDIRIIPVS